MTNKYPVENHYEISKIRFDITDILSYVVERVGPSELTDKLSQALDLVDDLYVEQEPVDLNDGWIKWEYNDKGYPGNLDDEVYVIYANGDHLDIICSVGYWYGSGDPSESNWHPTGDLWYRIAYYKPVKENDEQPQ